MINKQTVLVLGAGASIPYGFPSGQRLVDLICASRSGFQNLVAACAKVARQDVSDFVAALSRADAESIDVFLGNNAQFENVGKAAIVATLLPLERESQLVDKWRAMRLNDEQPKVGGHWYKYLAGLLLSNTSFDQFDENKLSVITFNYERSLEHYLYTNLQSAFKQKSPEECAGKVHAIEVIHVYGQLGYLPWQDSVGQKIAFGSASTVTETKQRSALIRTAMQGIRTVADDFDENDSKVKHIRELLAQASNIYILGFGYHPLSTKILGIESLRQDKNIRGTSLGLSLQRKIAVGRLGISTLQFDAKRMNARWLYDEDVYDFLYHRVTLG